ncbi:hypothetical protein CU098_008149 [Rhizopus stolonifer]|uniref:Uncharacterized protein n=1 Tax=Rhizopus stolonifer TaxID=4846 RepID=A0A367J5K7_RHIST|nr:hypothetical protein CU098_008149 [Rhizopus stolonifer]
MHVQVLVKKPKIIAYEADEGSVEEQVENVMSHIYKSLRIWQKTTIVSEAFYVEIVKIIMNFIFDDTNLQIVSGENCSNSTKHIRSINEALYGSHPNGRVSTITTDNLCGCEVDMMIATDKEVELAAFEFKKKSDTSKDSIYQKSKSVRINVSVDEVLCCFSGRINAHMGMDWCVLGPNGYTYVVREYEGVYVAKKVKDLKLPFTKDELLSNHTKELILSLYELKYFYLEYSKKLPNDLSKKMLNSAQVSIIPTIVHSPKIKSSSI